MNNASPLKEAEIAALFAPLQAFDHVLLAVSGGPDSMALLALAAEWMQQSGAPRFSVACVDHGFRPEARAEAEFVAEQAGQFGLACHVLIREGAVPKTGLQEAARDARYDLLFDCARRIGAQAVATAHHADDQAETVLMRLCRGSGPGGLGGMRADTPRGALTLVRPFLALPRERLQASLAARGIASIADPSNADPRFERVRLRQLGETLAGLGLSRDRLVLLGARAARADAALDRAAEMALAQHRIAGSEPPGFGPALWGEPREIVIRVLAEGLARVGSGRPVRLERLEDLAEALCAARDRSEPDARTLGGAVFRIDAAGMLTLAPERPRRNGA